MRDGAGDVVAGGCERGAEGDLQQAGDDQREVVEFAEPDVALVAGEVGSVAAEQRGLGVEGATGDDPAGVRPPGAVVRGVRVAFVVGVLMMDAVGGDPEDGSAFEGEGAAGGDEVLQPLGRAVAAVREQAVVGHADADVDGEEVHDAEDGEVLPGEAEERGDGADVEEAHDDGGDPVDSAFLVLAAHAEVLLDLLGDFGGETAGGFDGFGCAGGSADAGCGLSFGLGCFRSQERRSHMVWIGLACVFRDACSEIPAKLTLAGCWRGGCKTFVMVLGGCFVRVDV